MRRRTPIVSARLLVGLGLGLAVSSARAAELTTEELAVIRARLASVESYTPQIRIAEGDTRFFEVKLQFPATRFPKPASAYEGVVLGIVAPPGIIVHPQADRLTFAPRGSRMEVRFVYALHVNPGTRQGGRVRLKAAVMERTGLANTIGTRTLRHRIKVTRPRPSDRDLAADFFGYRRYAQRARNLRERWGMSGHRLRMADEAPLPSLSRARPEAAQAIQRFGRLRRRMWVAHRHLEAASQHPDPRISTPASRYLAALEEPERALAGLPQVPLAARPPPAPPPRRETATAASKGRTGPLEPVATYDPNAPYDIPPPATENSSPPSKTAVPPSTVSAATSDARKEVRSDDPLAQRTLRKRTPIPGFSRGLVLDDPNIAHSVSARVIWAEATVRESATVSAFFFHGQTAFTPSLGVEVTVPVELVDIDEPDHLDRIQSVFATGNPLLSAKYRLHLPPVAGRRPALTLRVRWSIPMSPLHLIPPTTLGAEDFTREVHFADTYAFLLEKTGLGLGINAAYQWGMVHVGAQVGSDVFLAVGDIDTTDKVTINYGFSVGVLPFGDQLGAFVEGRAVSLLPARTEFFTYVGTRGQVFGLVEPAVWVGLPLGSVRNTHRLQIGGELRFSYDVDDVVEARIPRRDDRSWE